MSSSMQRYDVESLPIELYHLGKKDRIRPGNILLDELTVLVMSVVRHQAERTAYKFDAEVSAVEEIDYGIFQVSFDVYDSRQRHMAELSERFNKEGFWRPTWLKRDIDGGKEVESGYFTDYDLREEESAQPPALAKGKS